MGDRSVVVEISNKTRVITLKNPRTYCFSGYNKAPPSPKISPGATESCEFTNSRLSFRGSVGVLVYEATNFTLAILFSNPYDHNLYSVELAVEISFKKAHLGSLEELYKRMYDGVPASGDRDTAFHRVKLSDCQEPINISAGDVKVTATMSTAHQSTIKVVVADK